MINILWIDDQPQDALMDKAYKAPYNMDITSCINVEDGIAELTQSSKVYDAIILDANCVRDAKGVQTPDITVLGTAFKRLSEKQITLPWVVYSAAGIEGEQLINAFIKANQPQTEEVKWYKKPSQMHDMLDRVKELAESSLEYQLKAKYSSLFNGYPNQKELLGIVKVLESNISNDPSVFNDMRKELEWIMSYCGASGVLQGTEFTGSNLADCSKAMCEKDLECIIPFPVQRSFHSATAICNNGSHRSQVDEMVKKGLAPYLVKSTIYEFFNIVNWLCGLPTDRDEIGTAELRERVSATIEKRKEASNTASAESVAPEYENKVMIVEQDDKDNYHCDCCRLSYKKAAEYLGKEVVVYNIKKNDKAGKDNYPYFADFKPV